MLLIIFTALIQNNNYAHFGGDYEPEYEEYVPVKVYLSKSEAKAKRYGDLKLDGFEWGLILIGTLLFNIGCWNLKEAKKSPEEKQHKYIINEFGKYIPNPHVSSEKREKRKKKFYWSITLIGFACLYPCLVGLFYHLGQGVIHIIGIAMLLIPFIIPIIIKK